MLHRAGRRAGRRFLDQHFDDIGVRSTIDLREEMRAEREEQMPAGVDRLAKYPVIPGRGEARTRNPEHFLLVWIPGSPLRGAPE